MLDNTPKEKQFTLIDILLATRDKHKGSIIISLLNEMTNKNTFQNTCFERAATFLAMWFGEIDCTRNGR